RIRRKWFYQYRSKIDGRQHRINVGNADKPAAISATKARETATRLSQSVQIGGDPQKERGTARKVNREPLLDAALKYLNDRKTGIIGKRPMRLSTFKAAVRYFELHWKALANRPAASITTEEVQRELRHIIERHGKIAAARAKSFMSAFYVWALKEGVTK